jgi:hypothetical protein
MRIEWPRPICALAAGAQEISPCIFRKSAYLFADSQPERLT